MIACELPLWNPSCLHGSRFISPTLQKHGPSEPDLQSS
jgi:hypothetical protein